MPAGRNSSATSPAGNSKLTRARANFENALATLLSAQMNLPISSIGFAWDRSSVPSGYWKAGCQPLHVPQGKGFDKLGSNEALMACPGDATVIHHVHDQPVTRCVLAVTCH
jgi:hypothetical protein